MGSQVNGVNEGFGVKRGLWGQVLPFAMNDLWCKAQGYAN